MVIGFEKESHERERRRMEDDEVGMSENAKIQLKWVYTPTDFFEEKETTLLPDYEHTIENGEVTVSMDLNEYQSLPGIQEQLHNLLIGIFRGAALVSQKPFTLKAGGEEIIYPDGRRSISLRVNSINMVMTMGNVDLIVKDQNGLIIANSKQERLNKRRKLSILSAKYRVNDPVVESILSSFEKSLNDPEQHSFIYMKSEMPLRKNSRERRLLKKSLEFPIQNGVGLVD